MKKWQVKVKINVGWTRWARSEGGEVLIPLDRPEAQLLPETRFDRQVPEKVARRGVGNDTFPRETGEKGRRRPPGWQRGTSRGGQALPSAPSPLSPCRRAGRVVPTEIGKRETDRVVPTSA